MDFTREPTVETVITPREGCKIVVRSSKSNSTEEFFVDAVEVVSFGHSIFFRSLEKPKPFLVPATDYEVLEVREARMVIKNVGYDRSIKIAGGRREQQEESEETQSVDKRRGRKRQYRRRKTQDQATDAKVTLPKPKKVDIEEEGDVTEQIVRSPGFISSLLPPPSTLISESISRYKGNETFEGAFYEKSEEGNELNIESPTLPDEPTVTEEEPEEVLKQRFDDALEETESDEVTEESVEENSDVVANENQH